MDERSSGRRWRDWLRTNQGVGVVLSGFLVGLLGYLLTTDWMYVRLRDGVLLGFFPAVAVVFMLFTAAGMITDRHRGDSTQELAESDRRTWLYPLLALPVLYFFFWVMRITGFVIIAPFVLAPVIYMFGARPWRVAITASLIITISVYAIFRIIGTNIPQGPLPF